MAKSKKLYVDLRTRVPQETADLIRAKATASYPYYRVVRDIVTAAVNGVDIASQTLRAETIRRLAFVAEATNYASIDELLLDLSAAFLRVYKFHHNEIPVDAPVPDEEIRDMFEEMVVLRYDGLRVRKST